MTQLTVPLAVEKVLYRLALMNAGKVTLARLFLELPLALEEAEEYADQVVNARTVHKDLLGRFVEYTFPELESQLPPAAFDDCPACGRSAPPAPTERGEVVRAPLLCDRCYGRVRTLARQEPDAGVVDKLRALLRADGEEEEDFAQVAATDHEVFFLGLRLGVDEFTHTTIAAQSRLPSRALKERLDRMGGRRYIHMGVMEEGAAVCYRFPPGLTYPRPLYERSRGPRVRTADDLEQDVAVRPSSRRAPGLNVKVRPTASEPPKPRIQIKVRERRRDP